MFRAKRFLVVASTLLSLIALPAVLSANGDVRLPRCFGSNMVLQRDRVLPIWGWAEPGADVVVQLGENKATAKADAAGRWSVKLPPMPAGGPHVMKVTAKKTTELNNILIGEVWICSGQSNMQWGIKAAANARKEIAAADYPKIRLFSVKCRTSGMPLDDLADATGWAECTPDTIVSHGSYDGGFSAVAYFFGRELHKELDVPIGLINTSWGGTRIEPWTPPEGFRAVPELKDIVNAIDNAGPAWAEAKRRTLDAIEAWLPAARKAFEEGKEIPPAPVWPPAHPLDNNTQPTGIYNAMIRPLIPYAIRGAIWYQGESNHADGMAYLAKMKALIGGWRSLWDQGEFPFYYVQLAPFDKLYEADELPRIWEAQTAAMQIPHTGMVVTTDIGDCRDIHPKNKQDVGKRLARWALARDYGRSNMVYSGPLYKSMEKDGSRIRIRFEHVGSGLASRDGKPLTWFTIAGEDKAFVPAEATIDGDVVVVSSDKVANPVAVRFAWDNIAEPNLMNKEGLPANSFRTDSW